MLNAIRTYLQRYPGLRGGTIHLECLPTDARRYSLSSVPCDPVLREYMDGGQRRQLLFTLQSRRFFGESIPHQQDNLRFFQDFDAWLRLKNQQGDLPDLGEDRLCLGLSMVTSGYVMDADNAGFGRCQAELKAEYFQSAPRISSSNND